MAMLNWDGKAMATGMARRMHSDGKADTTENKYAGISSFFSFSSFVALEVPGPPALAPASNEHGAADNGREEWRLECLGS
jgi:hypothetical protein